MPKSEIEKRLGLTPGSGRLPSMENLRGKSADDLLFTLNRFGIKPNIKELSQRADAAYVRLEKAIDAGLEPDEHTWEAIDGQIQSELERGLRKMTKDSIRNYRQSQLSREELAMWVAVNGGDKSCPSCEDRHGQIQTVAEWAADGMPGSGALICDGECLCDLVPVEADDGEETDN